MNISRGDQLGEITKRLKTSSAVVPILIFDAICVPIGIAGMIYTSADASSFFGWLAGGPVVLTGLQISFFTLFDRDRLQNEDHVERKMLIGQLEPQFGDSHSNITIDHKEPLVGNPANEEGKDV
jgi:hypothetical protein